MLGGGGSFKFSAHSTTDSKRLALTALPEELPSRLAVAESFVAARGAPDVETPAMIGRSSSQAARSNSTMTGE